MNEPTRPSEFTDRQWWVSEARNRISSRVVLAVCIE